MAQRQRNLLVGQRQQELLSLCARAEMEPDADRRLSIYRQTRANDLGEISPGVREIVLRILDRIAAQQQQRQAVEDGPQLVLPPGP